MQWLFVLRQEQTRNDSQQNGGPNEHSNKHGEASGHWSNTEPKGKLPRTRSKKGLEGNHLDAEDGEVRQWVVCKREVADPGSNTPVDEEPKESPTVSCYGVCALRWQVPRATWHM